MRWTARPLLALAVTAVVLAGAGCGDEDPVNRSNRWRPRVIGLRRSPSNGPAGGR